MSTYPDVNHYHPVSNWMTIKGKVKFLISKATQGIDYIDPTLDSFIKGCETNKIPYYLYTFIIKGKELDSAKYLVSKCKNKVGKYFVGYALDIEKNPTDNTYPNTTGCISALKYLEGLGYKTLLYTGYTDYNRYKSVIQAIGSNTAWWEARYGANNGSYNSKYPCHSGVDLHQYTSKGVCSGVSGKCDLNRLTGRKSESWFTTPLTKTSTLTTNTTSNTSTATAASSSTNTVSTKLSVDGVWGKETTKRAQKIFGTTVDGKISNQLNTYKSICAGITSAEWSTAKKGGSALIKAIQKWLEITQDGYIGPEFIKTLQKKMGTTVDGKLDNPSQCIKAFQTWLNKQQQ